MQSSDQASEPNLQPQVETAEPSLEPKPLEGHDFQSQQTIEPILHQESQQDNPAESLPEQEYYPPESYPPSQDQHKFDEFSEPNHPEHHIEHMNPELHENQDLQFQQAYDSQGQQNFEPQIEYMNPEPQESQNYQFQQAYEPVFQQNPEPQENQNFQSHQAYEPFYQQNFEPQAELIDPKPQESQAFQYHQVYETILEQEPQQSYPQNYEQVYQPPVVDYIPPQEEEKFVYEPNYSQPQVQYMNSESQENQNFQLQQVCDTILQQNHQPQVELIDLKPQEDESFQFQPPRSSIFQQEPQPPPIPGQAYQEQLPFDYSAYHQEVQQGRNAALKEFMIEHISERVKAPGRGFIFLYYLLIILGSVALAYMFYSQNDYTILLKVFKQLDSRDFEIQGTFRQPGSCQCFVGVTLAVPLFLGTFAILNFLDLCGSCFGMQSSMYYQFFMAGIWTAFAGFAIEQHCTGNTLKTAFGDDYVLQNPWVYYFGMNFASLGAGMLSYIWSNNKTQIEKDKKELALVLAAC